MPKTSACPLLFRLVRRFLPLLLTGFAAGQSNSAQPSSAPQLSHFDPAQVDRSLDPCTDFYQFTCKKWMASNPIPPDQVNWWLGSKLMIWNQSVVRNILDESSVNDAARNPAQQKIGDYYSSCMNEDEINKKGLAPIKPALDRIDALRNKAQLAEELAYLHEITFALAPGTNSGSNTALFGFSSGQDLDDASKVVAVVDQGGLGLPDRSYYLNADQKSTDLRQQYVEHLGKTFQLLGEDAAKASADAKIVMAIETSLATSSMDIVKRRDPANLNHKLSSAELAVLTPSFSWKQYLDTIGAPTTDHYLVATPDFFKGVNQLIDDHSLDDWKTYLRWQLVNAASPLLSTAFADEKFDFYGRALQGQKAQRPRWRRCVQNVNRDLDEALGEEYVARAFAGDRKQQMLKLVHDLEAALNTDIQHIDWMTPPTRKAALAKLATIEDKIGYPDHWRDYSALSIDRSDALGNAFRSSQFEFRRQLAKIGKPVDRSEWSFSASVPNAYYDPQLNTIIFPAAILQPPLFDSQADPAANYGAVGAIIGHELTHGFDDEGSKFDGTGNLHNWWTPDDSKAFGEKEQCFADEYSGFESTEGVKLNGKLTLGENTADNGGLRIAFMALLSTLSDDARTKVGEDGFTPEQRFFAAYGEALCANSTPQYLRMAAQSDPHSSSQFRVNGVLSNMPEFQQAFGCKKGQPMVREPACRVW